MIGKRCRIINATVPKNSNITVIVTGDAGVRPLNTIGETQCYFIDREIETRNGKMRNWTSEYQLEPLDDLVNNEEEKSKDVCEVIA